MKIRPFLLLLLFSLGSAFHLEAQFAILNSRDSKSVGNEKNMTYYLPRTQVNFLVEVKREKFIPGRFAAFAEDLLGLGDVPQYPSTQYRIESIRMHSVTEADPRQRYFFPRALESRKGSEDVAILTENGILVYYGKATHASRGNVPHDHLSAGQHGWITLSEPLPESPLEVEKDILDTVMQTIQHADTILKKPVVRTLSGRKSELELATEIANQYIQLKESRFRLLTGYQEVSYSKEALQYMDEGLKMAMDECLAMFKGSISEETRTYSFSVIPTLDRDSVWVPLFRFSPQQGVFPSSESRGDIIYVRWTGMKQYIPRNKQLESAEQAAEESKSLLWYRIPSLALFEIRRGSETIYTTTAHIAQLGLLQSIPYNKLSVEFDPVSGQAVKIIFDN